eukprot:13395818-Alexandrium_andersonii.AAC.1
MLEPRGTDVRPRGALYEIPCGPQRRPRQPAVAAVLGGVGPSEPRPDGPPQPFALRASGRSCHPT